MATTPSALSTLTTAQSAVVTRAVGVIDAELRLKRDDDYPTKIRRGIIDFVFKENRQVLDSILDQYRASGWTIIEYTSDDQGDWFMFYPS